MHARWRRPGEACPIDGKGLSWSRTCGDCVFFRGLSSGRGILCNWPVNGTHRDDGPDLSFDAAGWARRMEES
jgi:hypothetical protein